MQSEEMDKMKGQLDEANMIKELLEQQVSFEMKNTLLIQVRDGPWDIWGGGGGLGKKNKKNIKQSLKQKKKIMHGRCANKKYCAGRKKLSCTTMTWETNILHKQIAQPPSNMVRPL